MIDVVTKDAFKALLRSIDKDLPYIERFVAREVRRFKRRQARGGLNG